MVRASVQDVCLRSTFQQWLTDTVTAIAPRNMAIDPAQSTF
jgi:hypothetical protein